MAPQDQVIGHAEKIYQGRPSVFIFVGGGGGKKNFTPWKEFAFLTSFGEGFTTLAACQNKLPIKKRFWYLLKCLIELFFYFVPTAPLR